MPTEIQNVGQDTFLDIFSSEPLQPGQTANFGGSNDDVNILDDPNKTKDTPPAAAAAADTPPVELDENGQPKVKTVELDENGQPKDVNILDDPNKAKPGRKAKYDFTDMTGYFEDRFKNKKFVPITVENEQGEQVPFIPKTPEEFDEVFQLQIDHKLAQSRKENDKVWYEGKSPAWKAVARYAEMVDDPSEILPFIQGVKTIESVSQLNEEEIDGAERIVRARMRQKGDTDEIIDEQIEVLKTADKLISTAKKFKPIILQQENAQLQQMAADKKEQEQEYQQMVTQIRTKALEAIEAPIFGKQKLKQEEKAAVYDLIAQPTSDGYGIYTEIDKLFQKGDFDTLRQIALMVAKKDSFLNYVSTSAADKAAEGLQKKLRIAGDSRTATGNDFDEEDVPPMTIQRNQYGNKARFGR